VKRPPLRCLWALTLALGCGALGGPGAKKPDPPPAPGPLLGASLADTLALVEAGAAALGIVYRTDAASSEAVLATNDDGGEGYNFTLTRDAVDGDVYYLAIRGYSGSTTGAYTLTIDGPTAGSGGTEPTPEPEPEPTPEPTGDVDVTVDVTNSNNVTETIDGFIDAGGEVDSYIIELRDDLASNVVLELKSTGGTDTYGSLYDADGNLLATDDDSGPSLNFKIAGSIPTGLYLVEVRGYDANTSGDYTLSVKASWQ